MNLPPDGLPGYRLLTGVDDAAFCSRVGEAVSLGYVLYGSPAATFDGKNVIVAQAVVWPSFLPEGRPHSADASMGRENRDGFTP